MKNKNLILISTSIISVLVFTLSLLIWPIGIHVSASPTRLSISVGLNQAQAAELSDWTIKFNPTGTHIQDGYLKVRLDFYPSETSKLYSKYYLNKPIFGDSKYPGEVDEFGEPLDWVDYQKWEDELPHQWQITEALSASIIVPPTIAKYELENYINDKFNATVIAAIENAVDSENTAHLLSPYMVDKVAVSTTKYTITDDTATIATVNSNLSGLAVTGTASAISETLTPHSIDAGAGATDRASASSLANYTIWDTSNPANATGTIDTFEFWFNTDATGVVAGTSYLVSGTTYRCRDSEAIGSVTAGAKRTFTGLTISVTSGDYAGAYATAGNLDYGTAGAPSTLYVNAEAIDPNDEASYSTLNRLYSLYATGTESGATPSITNTPSSEDLGTAYPDGRAIYAKGTAPNNPVVAGDCTFTVTNNGTSTCNVTILATNPTPGWTWGTPASDVARCTAYYVGQNPASGVVLTTTAQAFYNGLAASGNVSWDFKFEMPTASTNTTQRTFTITLTAITP